MSQTKLVEFWQGRVVAPLVAQLKQGITPKHLALSCALGITLGLFPILGTTTLLCFLAGIILKLNQPAIQAVNYLVYPAQLALFPVFVRAGAVLFGETPVTLSPVMLTREFSEGPVPFLAKYGMAGLHGIVVWLLVAPFIAGCLYVPLHRAFQKMNLKKSEVL